MEIYNKKYKKIKNTKYKNKKDNKNNKFKISVPTWNEDFQLSDGSYFVSYIQVYFGYILKNMKQLLIILQEEFT